MVLFRTGVEYAVFPYKEVNTKFFTVSYTVDARRNAYFDTTLYEKTKETMCLSLKRKKQRKSAENMSKNCYVTVLSLSHSPPFI